MQPQKLIFFGLGAFAIALSVAMAFGSPWLLEAPSITDLGRPGIGITAIAFLDLIFVYTLMLIGLDFLPVAPAFFARIQGIVTFIVSLVGVIGSFTLILLTFTFLMMMVSLFLTMPFGTFSYLAIWGNFDTERAKVILTVVMILKLVGVGFILFASPSFLKNKGFMLLILCSLGLSFVLGLLHALPPGILVSITDAVGAIITYVVLFVWTLIQLVGSLFAIVRAIRSMLPT